MTRAATCTNTRHTLISLRHPRRLCEFSGIGISYERWFVFGLGIIIQTLRVDNLLFYTGRYALLSDFSSCCPAGYPNYAVPLARRSVPRNGLGKTLSQGTDMFAMGSLVYEIETGKRAELFVDNESGAPILPKFSTGHSSIDSMVRNAWLRHHASTAQMLAHIESLVNVAAGDSQGPIEYQVSIEEPRTRVKQWREMQLKHGETLLRFFQRFFH